MRERLGPFYEKFGVNSALPVLDEMMCLVAATAFRSIEVNCPCKSHLGEDELLLLRTMQALQRQDRDTAIEMVDDLLCGSFRITFCRIADAYLEELQAGSLGVTGVRYLSAVPSYGQAAQAN
ncbi:MAG: hypothetical protein AAF529_16290 [Pseudomonadota bacterium]